MEVKPVEDGISPEPANMDAASFGL